MHIRHSKPFDGNQFIGNAAKGKMRVHDTENEVYGDDGCQIGEIKEVKTFTPDSMSQAKKERFEPCEKCARRYIER